MPVVTRRCRWSGATTGGRSTSTPCRASGFSSSGASWPSGARPPSARRGLGSLVANADLKQARLLRRIDDWVAEHDMADLVGPGCRARARPSWPRCPPSSICATSPRSSGRPASAPATTGWTRVPSTAAAGSTTTAAWPACPASTSSASPSCGGGGRTSSPGWARRGRTRSAPRRLPRGRSGRCRSSASVERQLRPMRARRVRSTMSSTGQTGTGRQQLAGALGPQRFDELVPGGKGEVMQGARHRRHTEHGVPLDGAEQLGGELGLADPVQGDDTARQACATAVTSLRPGPRRRPCRRGPRIRPRARLGRRGARWPR